MFPTREKHNGSVEFLEPVSIELDVGGADHLGPLG